MEEILALSIFVIVSLVLKLLSSGATYTESHSKEQEMFDNVEKGFLLRGSFIFEYGDRSQVSGCH